MTKLKVIATPIGNLQDLTPRAAQALKDAQVVFAEDTRVSRVLLQHVGSSARLESLHAHNERGASSRLLAALQAGERVALVSDAGTPLVSDPGAVTVAEIVANGFEVEPLPGPSAVAVALQAAGFVSVPYAFFGFFERTTAEQATQMAKMRTFDGAIVFFETKHRIAETLATLRDRFGQDRQAVVCRELTKQHEQMYRGTLGALADAFAATPVKGELTIVLAPAAELLEQENLDSVIAELAKDSRPLPARAKELMQRSGLTRAEAYARLRTANLDSKGEQG